MKKKVPVNKVRDFRHSWKPDTRQGKNLHLPAPKTNWAERKITYQVAFEFKVLLRRKSHLSNLRHFKTQTSSHYEKKNDVYNFQIKKKMNSTEF